MRQTVSIMFHTVGLNRHDWRNPNISEPAGHFARKIGALHERGYRTVFYRDVDPNEHHNRKEVALTFDDGYLDNWVHVFPILQKYGMKATIFVTPEFVDPRDVTRPQAPLGASTDVDHDAARCCAGFLSWPEMRAMEATGLVDVQSHALTHTWYFKGPRVVDFWRPGAATERMGPVWLLWNRFPDFKPYYLTQAAEYESRIPFGTPIYEHGKSLETVSYEPLPELGKLLSEHVERHGGPAFFSEPKWREQLTNLVEAAGQPGGKHESPGAHRARIRHELAESKCIIEEHLDKRVCTICWPGGSGSALSAELAAEVGYTHATRLGGCTEESAVAAISGMAPRMGSPHRVRFRGRDLGESSPREFLWRVERNARGGLPTHLSRAALLFRLARSYAVGA